MTEQRNGPRAESSSAPKPGDESQQTIKQFLGVIQYRQARVLAALNEDNVDDALWAGHHKELRERGSASLPRLRTRELWQPAEREAEQHHARAIAAGVNLPSNLAGRWIDLVDRLMALHRRFLDRCLEAAENRRQIDWDLVQDNRQLMCQALRELNALPAVLQAVAAPGGPTPVKREGEQAPTGPAARGTVHQRILDELHRNPVSADWSQRDWAAHLHCSPAAVAKASAWQTVKKVRAVAQTDRLDRRRRRQG